MSYCPQCSSPSKRALKKGYINSWYTSLLIPCFPVTMYVCVVTLLNYTGHSSCSVNVNCINSSVILENKTFALIYDISNTSDQGCNFVVKFSVSILKEWIKVCKMTMIYSALIIIMILRIRKLTYHWLILSWFYWWGNWDTPMWHNLPDVIPLKGGRVMIWRDAVCLQSLFS